MGFQSFVEVEQKSSGFAIKKKLRQQIKQKKKKYVNKIIN